MILHQAMMNMSKPEKKRVPKLVMLSEYGLAIHKGEDDNKTYTISHFESGRSVLKYIKERKNVEGYIKRLLDICASWHFTLEEFDESEWKTDLKRKVDKIQKEILQGEKA